LTITETFLKGLRKGWQGDRQERFTFVFDPMQDFFCIAVHWHGEK
jgi:hypothetical protein